MKHLLLSLACIAALHTGASAQIKLMGASVNTATGKIDLVQWDALDSASVSVTPTFLDGYYFATSAFDAYNANYYITGISGDSVGLYAYNVSTTEESLSESSAFTTIAEFDMSTGMMYNLIMETEEYISIYAFDIATNTDSLIGTIYEPGAIGIVADAIGFDSNNGILYYVGFGNDPYPYLYAVPVRDAVFSYTKTILAPTAPYNSITSVNFDNVNEVIYALNDTYDSLFNFTGRYIVEIDKVSGDIINRGDLAEFPYYVGGSSTFDQTTGTFLVAAIDTNFALKMVAFSTLTDTYEAGFMPDLVSEIVCDNSSFARYAYTTTSIAETSAQGFNVYPNPVSDVLSIEYAANGNVVNVQVFSATGQLVLERDYTPTNRMDLDLRTLTPGLYTISLTSAGERVSEKVMVY